MKSEQGEKKVLTGFAGRPSEISQEQLLHTRDCLVQLFQTIWGEGLGYGLHQIKTVADVRPKLQMLAPHRPDFYVIRALLNPADRELSAQELTHLEKQRTDLRRRIGEVGQQWHQIRDGFERLKTVCGVGQPKRHRKFARRRLVERSVALKQSETYRASLQKELDSVVVAIEEAHPHFAREELVKFCTRRRYTIDPTSAANALAGLPCIGYRRSIDRCRETDYDREPRLPFQVFEEIGRIVRSRKQNIIHDAEAWLRAKPGSSSIDELCRNWRHFRNALAAVSRARPHPKDRHYRIAAEYFQRVRTRSPMEKVLAEEERIIR